MHPTTSRLGPPAGGALKRTPAGRHALLAAACALALLSGCVEEREVTRRSSFTGMQPVRTKTSEPKVEPPKAQEEDFFAPVGQGIAELFEEKGEKSKGWEIVSPTGQKIKLPKEYTGQTVFRTREGRAYRLTFKEGVLVMIEDELKPGVSQLKPGAGASGTLGGTGAAAPAGAKTPGARPPTKTPTVEDEGEVPQPTGPRPPLPTD